MMGSFTAVSTMTLKRFGKILNHTLLGKRFSSFFSLYFFHYYVFFMGVHYYAFKKINKIKMIHIT